MDKKKVRDYMTYDVITIPAEGTCREVMEKIQTTGHDASSVVK
jgi:IMP dehydrogenase